MDDIDIVAHMKRDKTFLIRVSAEELELAEAYRTHNGLRSSSDAFRDALKNDAARLGISVPKKVAPQKHRTPRG
jgi:hypothetical protein